MKKLSVGMSVVFIVLLFVMGTFAADAPLTFKDFKGDKEVLVGPVYTYSVQVDGTYSEIGWNATGGKVLRDWWEKGRYSCEVQWVENNADDPAKLKVWGTDKASGDTKEFRFPVTFQSAGKKRSLDYRKMRNIGGKCLAIQIEDLLRDGGHVYIWECKDEVPQRWKFDELGRLVNEGGKCLDVHQPDMTTDGGKVQVWECSDVPQQKWTLDDKGHLVNGGGKCLDINASEIGTDGGKVQIWECGDVDNQKWKPFE